MTFDIPDPNTGQPLDEYLTPAYFAELHRAIRYLLKNSVVRGGPGVTSTQFGGTTTLKASRRFGGGGMGIPLTETITISNGVGGDVGFWVDEDGNKVDFIELDICVNNVEKKLRLLGMIIEP